MNTNQSTPTDPREEEIAECQPLVKATTGEVTGAFQFSFLGLYLLSQPWDKDKAGEVLPIIVERLNSHAKLAAEIAELKALLSSYHFDTSNPPAVVKAIIEGNIKDRAELEAARKERDEIKAVLFEKDAAYEQESPMLRPTKASVVSAFARLQTDLDTALAAKDAAEKMLREINFAIAGLFWTSDDGFHMRDSDPDESGAPRWFIEKWKALRAALTPAPTQEPPAGGVTISTVEKERDHWKATAEFHYNARLELERERDRKGGDSSCAPSKEPTHQDSSKCASNSPADVPSEGRGELLPFNLSDALAGKPVVTRDGSWRGTLVAAPNLDADIIGDYVAIAVMTAGPFLVLRDGRLFNDRLNDKDLFMLPPEGSGA